MQNHWATNDLPGPPNTTTRCSRSATSVLIGFIATRDFDIRVGLAESRRRIIFRRSVIAEQFGTLESLFPGRIELDSDEPPEATAPECELCAGFRRGAADDL